MGTTATIAGLLGDTLYLAQVGDSRAYLVRNGVARQITKDQSLMQKLIEAGEITEAEAEHSERRNIILQALGPEPSIKIDLTHQQVRRGDLLVLCSDGLSGQVSKEEIARVVSGTSDLTAACKALIDRANASGGPDNITVIVARFDGAGLRAPNDDDAVGHQVFPLPETGQTPAMSIDRVVDQHAPTGPVEAVRRNTRPIAGAAVPPAVERRKTAPLPADDAPMVSATRRSVGRLIAVTLLGLLLLGVGYFAVKMYGSRPAPDTTRLGAPGSPRH
jgi:protein phosphatase